MNTLDEEFWSNRYKTQQTGWDIGSPSPPLKAYIDQLSNKSLKILIPGCGNAYEASYLLKQGFHNVYLLDIAEAPLKAFLTKEPTFPRDHIIQSDFFKYKDTFDLILEQTFFCALHPDQRLAYAEHVSRLLTENGKLAGLLFSKNFDFKGPPFGGSKKEYQSLFSSKFSINILENCYNSISPRMGNELFFIFEKK